MFKKLLAILAMFYAVASFAAVDVNTATAADLDGVKGIGPGISGKIIEERKKGQFKDWNDLITRVKGVGNKNAAKFSTSGMTVNGTAYAGAPAAPAKEPKAKKEKKAATADAAAPATAAAPAAPAAPATAGAGDRPAKAAAPKPSKKASK